MPTNACVAFYDCKGCGKRLKPLPRSCCVFCSYGSVPCPPVQAGVEPCCTPIPEQRSKDWLGSARSSLLAWWIPTALIVAGLPASNAVADGHLGCCSRMDGNRLPAQCEAVQPDSLPVYRALLPGDDRSSGAARGRGRPVLCVAGFGSAHSLGRQDHLVGDRAHLGNFLLTAFAACVKTHGSRRPGVHRRALGSGCLGSGDQFRPDRASKMGHEF
jgi:hypothetical protein